jgi:hypothetical protein
MEVSTFFQRVGGTDSLIGMLDIGEALALEIQKLVLVIRLIFKRYMQPGCQFHCDHS